MKSGSSGCATHRGDLKLRLNGSPSGLANVGISLYSVPSDACAARRWRVPARPIPRDIMAVPKRKTSRMKRGFRRSADALKAPTYVEDKDSGELRLPHHVDLKTGMYRGRQVLKVKTES